jgi:hypothetical protein
MSNELDRIEKISIFFNKEQLDRFIVEIENDFNLSLLDTNDFGQLQTYQEEIRNLMIKHQQHIKFVKFPFKLDKSFTSHPNIFALFLYLISRGVNCNSWQDLFVTDGMSVIEYNVICCEYQDHIDIDSKCCCNHSCILTKQFIVSNMITELNLLIGDDCVEKLMTKERLNILKKQREDLPTHQVLVKKRARENKTKRQMKKLIPSIKIYRFIIKCFSQIRKHGYVNLRQVIKIYGKISYYMFFQNIKINPYYTDNYDRKKKWTTYIQYCLSPKSNTNLNTVLALETLSKKFKL